MINTARKIVCGKSWALRAIFGQMFFLFSASLHAARIWSQPLTISISGSGSRNAQCLFHVQSVWKWLVIGLHSGD